MHKVTYPGIRRDLRKRVPLERGEGFTTVADGEEVAEIEVVIDTAEIARCYGPKAMQNKSGVSKFMFGAVQVRVKSRKHVY